MMTKSQKSLLFKFIPPPTPNMTGLMGESTNGDMKILHEHYMKDVSSRHVINYLSAHPEEMKVNVLVNEALRILRNCS